MNICKGKELIVAILTHKPVEEIRKLAMEERRNNPRRNCNFECNLIEDIDDGNYESTLEWLKDKEDPFHWVWDREDKEIQKLIIEFNKD